MRLITKPSTAGVVKEWERDRKPLYQSNIELSDTVVTYGNVYGFRGLSIRFCVISMDSTPAILQCLAFPTSVTELKTILNEQNALGGQTVVMESAGVPCMKYYSLRAAMNVCM